MDQDNKTMISAIRIPVIYHWNLNICFVFLKLSKDLYKSKRGNEEKWDTDRGI